MMLLGWIGEPFWVLEQTSQVFFYHSQVLLTRPRPGAYGGVTQSLEGIRRRAICTFPCRDWIRHRLDESAEAVCLQLAENTTVGKLCHHAALRKDRVAFHSASAALSTAGEGSLGD